MRPKEAIAGWSLPLSLPVDPFKIPDPTYFLGNGRSDFGTVPPLSAGSNGCGIAFQSCTRGGDPSESPEGVGWVTNRPARTEGIFHPPKLAHNSKPSGRKEVIDC